MRDKKNNSKRHMILKDGRRYLVDASKLERIIGKWRLSGSVRIGGNEVGILTESGSIRPLVQGYDIDALDNMKKTVQNKALTDKQTIKPRFFFQRFSLFSDEVIDFCAFLLHKDYRETFLGDIQETRQAMLKKGWSKSWVNFNTFLKILSALKASIWFRMIDFFHEEKERNK